MDDGPADGPPGKELRTVCIELTPEEAADLFEALLWHSDEELPSPGWHTHITDSEGRELTVAISRDTIIAKRFNKPSRLS